MSKLPWFKFNPSAWRTDDELGGVSLAARGLWIELMAIMHGSTTYGHLLVRGKPPTLAHLAALVRSTPDQVAPLLAELAEMGVSSVTADGVIFSRRMVRDAQISESRASAGAAGGFAKANSWQTPSKSDGDLGEDDVANGQQKKPLARERARACALPSSSPSPSEPLLVQESAPVPAKRPRAAKPALPWPDVLADPEFDALRDNSAWMAAWAEWVEYRATLGAKYPVPSGATARKEFRYALKVGLPLHAAAIDTSIRKGWKGIDVEWVRGGGSGPSGRVQSHADRAIEDFKAMGGKFEGEMFGEDETPRIGRRA